MSVHFVARRKRGRKSPPHALPRIGHSEAASRHSCIPSPAWLPVSCQSVPTGNRRGGSERFSPRCVSVSLLRRRPGRADVLLQQTDADPPRTQREAEPDGKESKIHQPYRDVPIERRRIEGNHPEASSHGQVAPPPLHRRGG